MKKYNVLVIILSFLIPTAIAVLIGLVIPPKQEINTGLLEFFPIFAEFQRCSRDLKAEPCPVGEGAFDSTIHTTIHQKQIDSFSPCCHVISLISIIWFLRCNKDP